jgi:radical SAM superfamily enzyme YgiQ (UPF0313 family)
VSTILFANPCWWGNDNGKLLRGIRAGSRWPFFFASAFRPDNFQFGQYTPYPIFLGHAAAWAERAMDGEHTVVMRDSVGRGESYVSFFTYLRDLRPDVLIVETGAAAWEHDRGLLALIKQHFTEIRIAVAGPTARSAYKQDEAHAHETSTPSPIDAFLLGEYEKNSVDFINGATGLLPFNTLTREEMNRQPFPMFDEGCWDHYWDACPVGARYPELQVWASRGCNAVCNFCSFPATMTNDDPLGLGGRKIRFYDTAWLEPMIRERMAKAQDAGKPLASVRFDGDTENAWNKHTLAICEMMKRIGLPWSMMCRADTSTREVWQAMKDSGCFGVKIGFESGSDRIVNEVVKKKLNIQEAAETAKFLRSIGLSVHGTFMIGHPTETAEERQMTHDFITKLYADNALNSHQLSGCAELDGTPLANSTIADPSYVRDRDGVHKVQELMKK